MAVFATAGHVDHGKSTLVRALTGTNPDRLKEEKARGLTIDLGFAQLNLKPPFVDEHVSISLVDVPGHVRFLKNMMAGVSAIDGCLFVIDAGESWMPQTEEHLRILELLNVTSGLIVVTKTDSVDTETLELAQLDIEDHVRGSFLEQAEVVCVSAETGEGIDQLKASIGALVEANSTSSRGTKRSRLWVDRSFTIVGMGTVVTGTLEQGCLTVGDELELHNETSLRTVKVRGIQNHNKDQKTVAAGNRVALNLTGVDQAEIARGHALAEPASWATSDMFDAAMSLLPSVPEAMTRKGAYAIYVGSAELQARIRILGNDSISPGAVGTVRVYLERKIPLVMGDKFVLRESGRNITVAGGEVLDVHPVRPASKAKPDKSLERVVTEHGWIKASQFMQATGLTEAETAERFAAYCVDDWLVTPQNFTKELEALGEQVTAAGTLGLDVAALNAKQRAVLRHLDNDKTTSGDEGSNSGAGAITEGANRSEDKNIDIINSADTDAGNNADPGNRVEPKLIVQGGRVTAETEQDPFAQHDIVLSLRENLFKPAQPAIELRGEVRELIRRGHVVESEGKFFAADAVAAAKEIVSEALRSKPEGLTMAEIRDLLNSSRKFALPLVGILDSTGITRRQGDLRIAGPRMPQN